MLRGWGCGWWFGVAVLLLALGAYFTQTLWLGALGRALVEDDGPTKADVIVVLGGDEWGTRIETAARLVRAGFAPLVLISGAPAIYDSNEADLAIPFIVRRGYPAKWFVALRNRATSTGEECVLLIPELERRKVSGMILVTSEFHTARAARAFRAAARAGNFHVDIHVVPAPDPYFHPSSWWRAREGRKIALGEWEKTVAYALGI